MITINPNKIYLMPEIMEVLNIGQRLTFRKMVARGQIKARKQLSFTSGKPWRWYCFGYELLETYKNIFGRSYRRVTKK